MQSPTLNDMREQNRDDFYEGPPLEDERDWHDGAVIRDPRDHHLSRPSPEPDPTAPLTDVDIPERGAYPLPNVVERPHEASDGMPPTGPLTRDPSLSRAADRAARGAPISAAGYDPSIGGEAPGPLGPTADQAPPGGGGADEPDDPDQELPAGQWGSSGSRP